ncbi:IclR family transcriptional regulator [Aeromicrobium piscarium]|uniref:Glycerol operon regulatory protein n=1 Tax=Aeromicrobium piscarium TaxID=2590901 RepID=A0A554RMB9_9ACTN|nr:IclR family transcriptional regulator [Aeromicrobium piscarium]TSD55275.1 IclR family transcriptional regulator [Aeromicrobium piscarium]
MDQRSDNALSGRTRRAASRDESSQVHLALDLLEYLGGTGVPSSLKDVAAEVDGPKATIHRLLATLRSRGYVRQEQQSLSYSLGIRCYELGNQWVHALNRRDAARPHLDRLNEVTGETVHLGVYDQGDVVYIEKLESTFDVVPKSYVGRRCPAANVATGRVLLAYQPADEIRAQLRQSLAQHTPDSVNDPEELELLLEMVRRDGYALNHGSYRPGVGGIAAPIRDHTGAVIAAVGLCLPEQRFGRDRFESLRAETVAAASAVSSELGSALPARTA